MTPAVRRALWGVGLVLAVVAGYALPWDEPWREVGPLLLALMLALIGLLVELAILARSVRASPAGPAVPAEAEPADGVVGIAPMAGVRSEPNGSDPRFRRFVACEPDGSDRATARSSLGARDAPPLLGRVVLVSVFIGRDGRAWSEAEIARAHASMLRAGAWIEREAIRWGAPVNLDLAETYFVVEDHQAEDVAIGFLPHGEEMQPFEEQGATKTLAAASRVAAQLGFRDAVALIEEINPRVPAHERVWMLHPRQAGNSHAIPLEDTELAGVSLAVCYAREANFPEPLLSQPPLTDPVSVAHELLHLFGARDKYGVPLRSFPARSVTTRDIMRLDVTSLSRLRIDPLTAREIGWTP